MAKYGHQKEDIKEIVAQIIFTYCGYGFSDYNQVLRDVEKNIHNDELDLEQDYAEQFKDESGNAIEELVYEVAEPITKKVCDKLEKAYEETADQVDHQASFLTEKNPNNPHPEVGLPSLFNGGK